MRLLVGIDKDVVEEVKRFLRLNQELVKSYSRNLPDVQCVETLLGRGFRPEDIVKYVVFVGVNDWNLVGLRGGATTLWKISMRKFMEGFESFEELARRVVEDLHGLRRDRKEQIISTSRGLDRMATDLRELIIEVVYRGKISIDRIRSFVSKLRSSLNSRIPLDKAANLIARVLYFVMGKEVVGEVSIMYDVHVAKVSMRLGIVRIRIDGMDIAALSLFNDEIRKSIVDTWNWISREVGLSPWHVDAFLWSIGRELCLFDDEVGYLSMSKPSCPAKRCGKVCPLDTVCRAAREHMNIALFSSRIARSEIVVIYGQRAM